MQFKRSQINYEHEDAHLSRGHNVEIFCHLHPSEVV